MKRNKRQIGLVLYLRDLKNDMAVLIPISQFVMTRLNAFFPFIQALNIPS